VAQGTSDGHHALVTVSLLNAAGELLSPPVCADHNDPTPSLNGPGTQSDLSRYGITLTEGQCLLLYDDDAEDGKIDDLIAVGIARRDRELDHWVAEIDRSVTGSAYVHFSELDDSTQRHWLRHRPDNGKPYRQ
jgi:hypothetical protein